MQPKKKLCHGVNVPPFFCCGWGRGLIFSSCFGVESILSVHCSHSTWTVDSRLSMPVFFLRGEGGRGGCSKQRVPNVVLLSPMKVGQRGGSLYFKIEPSILGSLYRSFLFECLANQIGSLPKIK
jgi:hypothetical protein